MEKIKYPHQFLCDAMLGSLAKWLRVLGFDTVYYVHTTDREIVARAINDHRTILTRDHHFLHIKAVQYLLMIDSLELNRQIGQVTYDLNLIPEVRLFSRCMECNAALNPVIKEQVCDQVPPYVYEHHNEFKQCLGCGRIYWAGNHSEEIKERLRLIFKDDVQLIDDL